MMARRRAPHSFDPNRLTVLEPEECRDLLAAADVGRIAFHDRRGALTVLPVMHVVDAWTVAFTTAEGAKLSAALRGDEAVFEADAYDPGSGAGWSVVAYGTLRRLSGAVVVRRLEALAGPTWTAAGSRPYWVGMTLQRLSGRRLPGPRSAPHNRPPRG